MSASMIASNLRGASNEKLEPPLPQRPATRAVLSRAELIERVWEQQVSGSNVVDAVIKSLRKKLGRDSACLETVIGHGYRFVGFRTS
jgi:hypothetical protein